MNETEKSRLITTRIAEELQLHPAARYVDFYKLFFQGTFGPGHLVLAHASVADYLHKELVEATNFDVPDFQDIGYLVPMYRVNLRLVREKKITLDTLSGWFVESCVEPPLTDEQWLREWETIDKVLTPMTRPDPREREMFLSRLREGDRLFGHSIAYRLAYHPHYRVVTRSHLTPFLEAR